MAESRRAKLLEIDEKPLRKYFDQCREALRPATVSAAAQGFRPCARGWNPA